MSAHHEYIKAREQAAECALSLAKAYQDAGGTIPPAERLKEMTVMDFITNVAAQNGIRFTFNVDHS